jgi:hypothetical protein
MSVMLTPAIGALRLVLPSFTATVTDRLRRFVQRTWQPGLNRDARFALDADGVLQARPSPPRGVGEQLRDEGLIPAEVFSGLTLVEPAPLHPVPELILSVNHVGHDSKIRTRCQVLYRLCSENIRTARQAQPV